MSKALEIELSRQIGRSGSVKIWSYRPPIINYNGGDLPQAVRDPICDSAIFLAITSPGYLALEYARRELRTFYEKAKSEPYGLYIELHPRIFNLLLDDISPISWPEEYGNVLGFRFYDDKPPGYISHQPSDPEGALFEQQVRSLADAIHSTLILLMVAAQQPPTSGQAEVVLPTPIDVTPESQPPSGTEILAPQDSAQVRPSGIFISYRRGESTIYAGRLYDKLTSRFGEDRVFMDIDTIEPGDDFVEIISAAVSSCTILLALINKQWTEATDALGRKRLDNPDDFVHVEISTALKRNVRVIPLLIQGASMPQPQDLPVSLTALARRHAFEISDTRWRQDVERLMNTLEKHLSNQ